MPVFGQKLVEISLRSSGFGKNYGFSRRAQFFQLLKAQTERLKQGFALGVRRNRSGEFDVFDNFGKLGLNVGDFIVFPDIARARLPIAVNFIIRPFFGYFVVDFKIFTQLRRRRLLARDLALQILKPRGERLQSSADSES